jgi:hypothetical protein
MESNRDFRLLPVAARWTVIGFAMAGLAALLSATLIQPSVASGRLLLLLSVAAGAARVRVPLLKGATLSFLTFVVLLAIMTDGLAVAMLVALCGVTVQTLIPSKKLVAHQLAFNAGMIAVTVTASWWTYHLLCSALRVETVSSHLIAIVIASFTYFLGNSVSVSLIIALTKGISAVQIWYQHFLFSAPSFLIAGVLALATFAVTTSGGVAVSIALLTIALIAYYCSIRISGLVLRHDRQTAAR